MHTTYRDPELAIELRRRALLAGLPPAPTRRVADAVFSRRLARTAGSAVASVGGGLVLGAGALAFSQHELWASELARQLPALLLGSWLAAAVAYALGRALGATWCAARGGDAGDGDAYVQVERLATGDAPSRAVRRAERLELASVALPLVALALLLPLTLHLLAAVAADRGVEDFGKWIAMSAAIVGHAHVALALCSVHAARRLCARPADGAAPRMPSAWRALGITAGVAALPGVLLLAIPPVLVFVTGVLFVPAAWAWARHAVRTERAKLGLAHASDA